MKINIKTDSLYPMFFLEDDDGNMFEIPEAKVKEIERINKKFIESQEYLAMLFTEKHQPQRLN